MSSGFDKERVLDDTITTVNMIRETCGLYGLSSLRPGTKDSGGCPVLASLSEICNRVDSDEIGFWKESDAAYVALLLHVSWQPPLGGTGGSAGIQTPPAIRVFLALLDGGSYDLHPAVRRTE